MLKRTKGLLLLTLLVVTGLAGTLTDSSLSQKERKQAIHLIKNSRTEILNSIGGLSDAQLNYKASPKDPSISELVTQMVAWERTCAEEIKTIMSQPTNSDTRLKITLTDAQLLTKTNPVVDKVETGQVNKAELKDHAETVKKFIAMRNNHIKYIRTSTEDLRNHVVSTPAGWIDCYQYYLLIANRSNYFSERIGQIRSLASFPKK